MGFKRKLCWLILLLMPLFLITGCGDLEPEMQDTMQETRTVILKMDLDHRSSSRTSSTSHVVLSQYNTHLILALPSGEDNLTSNYEYFYSNSSNNRSFAQGLMNTEDNTVSLEIPLNKLYTEMKIYAFLFQTEETYNNLTDFFSGTRTLGYYGGSDSFYILELPDPLDITLCQFSGTGTDTGCETDTTAPTVSSVYPADNQNEVSITENISVTFSEAMDTTSVTTNMSNTTCSGSFQLSSNNFSSCIQMSSSPSSSNSYRTFTVDPSINLSHSTNYKIRVTTGVKDIAGNSMSSQYISDGFTTASP